MKSNEKLSRRTFVKTSAMAAGALTGTSLGACSTQTSSKCDNEVMHFTLPDKTYDSTKPVAGLLFSQIGYEQGFPVRVIVRLPDNELLQEDAICLLIPANNEKKYEAQCTYWGEVWKSHWWVAEFIGIGEQGEWDVEIINQGECVMRDKGLRVAKDILWDATIVHSAVDMLERRVHFTKVGAGWQDAGTLWVESPAQSGMIIAIQELIDKRIKKFDKNFIDRIYRQIIVGCNYLVMLREKAKELGFPEGTMSHDLHGHEKDILPHDAAKAVVALWRAVRLLPEQYQDQLTKYRKTAELTYDWIMNTAKPMGDYGLSRFQRALSEETPIPDDEWQTRDIVTWCWAALEKWKVTGGDAKEKCIDLARQIMDRQISESNAENGYFGHFLEYGSMSQSEKAWTHGIVNNQFGADIGQFYPNYLMPLIEMIQLWPDHEDAEKWKNSLNLFVEGYLIPACSKNPFGIIPLGIFGEEGPIWFCGTFHGTNTIYGYTGALALELAQLLDKPELKDIAYGNLQWLAGLNGGITVENLKACVVFSTDVPENVALPASMVCGIGNRWAGTWFATRGVICNGFSTGKQFVYDVEPKNENDGPFSLTDEDWIPHSAGWVTCLVRL